MFRYLEYNATDTATTTSSAIIQTSVGEKGYLRKTNDNGIIHYVILKVCIFSAESRECVLVDQRT